MKKEVDKIIENVLYTQDLDRIATFPFLAMNEKASEEDLYYFLNSGNKVRLFMNKGIPDIDKPGEELSTRIAEVRKYANKIGHALHVYNPIFREVAFGQNTQDVMHSIGFDKPIVCQSMYVLKQAFTESYAPGHQDASYLHVEPRMPVGLWVAVEDSTPDNGCLKIVPGSHKDGLKRRYIRNTDERGWKEGKCLYYTNTPCYYDQENFVSVPVKAGSAILLDGLVVHKSTYLESSRPRSRDVFAFHIYDSANGAKFSEDNWMKYTPETFLPLY